jgi:hypothetical protein
LRHFGKLRNMGRYRRIADITRHAMFHIWRAITPPVITPGHQKRFGNSKHVTR